VIGGDAAAAPSEPAPAVQRPSKLPAVPTPPGETAPAPAGEPPPPGESDASGTAEPPPPTPPDDEMIAYPPPDPPPRTGPDPALVDAAWEGVDGFDVEVRLKGGRELVGRVGAVQKDTFTLIQAKTGAVLVLPKSGVSSLRVRVPAPMPMRTGGGLLAGGIVLTTCATPVFFAGVAFLAICPSCAYIHLPMLLVGAGALAGGIPMIVRGAKHRRAYLEALDSRSFAAAILPTRHGWTGGIRFRF
jgi:hypothetical protein